ncbi:MAG: type II toxin-antitoxin system Phd/YefM family antitoxin [Acidobacteriota bacterium]
MIKVTVGKLKTDMADTLNKAAFRGERFLIERRGKPVAALVPLEDLKILEEAEDRLDAQEATRRLADPQDEIITYKELCRELGWK